MNQPHILIVEDDPGVRSALESIAKSQGCLSTSCPSGRKAGQALQSQDFQLVLLDLGLPDMDGMEVLRNLRKNHPALPVVILTAHGTLDRALSARQLGVESFLIKPMDAPDIARIIRQHLEQPATAETALPPAEADASPVPLLIGAAPSMQRTLVRIAQACASDATVLITGPTGSGKSLAARVIHANSVRRTGPMVTLSCASLPESLLESELFGHEKNAFTGAAAARPGHLEKADRGTLFLDEIGDIPASIQIKLLRFLDDRIFYRVGGREERKVNTRIVAATHRDLRAEVAAGRFREDLLYRLQVLEIPMPALTDRQEDIQTLGSYFLANLAPDRAIRFSDAAAALLKQYPWPGNVRELRHAVEHALAISTGSLIQPSHLPPPIRGYSEKPETRRAELAKALERWLESRLQDQPPYDKIHDELEAILLRALLSRYGDRPSVLARELQMNRATLLKKRRDFGLEI